MRMRTRLPDLGFQSTLPYGSDLASVEGSSLTYQFQSTLPYGSDVGLDVYSNIGSIFQSTLPYGSDSCWKLVRRICDISIHAPVWERRR